jgi:uncharacterized protein (TIGR03032 family)
MSTDSSAPVTLACAPDEGFVRWLAASGGSLAISTYQAGKLLLVGWNGRQVSFLPRNFEKPMGLDVAGDQLVLATRHQVWRFANAGPLAHHYRKPGEYDALFLPRSLHPMPDLNIHDVALAGDTVWLVNTRLSCLATLSSSFTFQPQWRPAFISDLAPEDRCHLNGIALRDGRPAFVTALGESNTAGGWRDNKASGGIVIDVDANRIVARDFAMPHSPRWHDGALWVLDSGRGELVTIDAATGAKRVVCALRGYLRGLAFVGRHALVGLCKMRETNIFGGMPVETRYDELLCAVAVIDTASGATVGMLQITQGCTELYDIRFLPGMLRPNVLNLEREDARQAIYAPDCYYWLRPEFEIKDQPSS